MTIQTQPVRTAAEQALSALLDQRLAQAGPASGRVGALRRDAAAAFAAHGLPHRRVEEWKYTDLRAALRVAAPPVDGFTATAEAEADFRALSLPHARRILFVDGQLSRAHSDLNALEPGLSVVPLATALAQDSETLGALAPQRYDGPLALNTAFLGDGLEIRVAEGAQITRPLHVAHVFTGDDAAATFTRRLVHVGTGARVTLVESFSGRNGVAYQVNDALELAVGDDSHVDYIRVQEEAGTLESRARLVTLLLDHAVPHCESRELFKTVLADESHGVFQGKIVVRQAAQKTDGRMMSQSLMLGEFAQMDNKPELEIFADDVQCGHGATAGDLDEDLLFYLKARGIPAKEAEAMLIEAFVGEALEFVENDDLRDTLIARAHAWLKKRAA
ncbi:MAG: hypothetical protein B7Z15_13240 [Rhizobiales bacterium 32-66-8]|nr:MAG: hypothetical protein B7Z15_13240 [Rhizobiales bacterium 32-66-8]